MEIIKETDSRPILLADIAWDKVPDQIKRQHIWRGRLKKMCENCIVLLMILPYVLLGWSMLFFSKLEETLYESSSVIVWELSWLWKILGSGLFNFVMVCCMTYLIGKIIPLAWKASDDNWHIYLDELARKYPHD